MSTSASGSGQLQTLNQASMPSNWWQKEGGNGVSGICTCMPERLKGWSQKMSPTSTPVTAYVMQ
eukprot:scaffold253526_cov17-Tisochrysis_lutea.AAC.1